MFNELMRAGLAAQMASVGSVPVLFDGDRFVKGVAAVIDHEVTVELGNGQVIANATTISLDKSQVGEVRAGNIIVADYDNPLQKARYKVGEIIADDGFCVEVYVRKL